MSKLWGERPHQRLHLFLNPSNTLTIPLIVDNSKAISKRSILLFCLVILLRVEALCFEPAQAF